MASAVKDVNEIFSRLFDHRPFLHTEITNFKREFEEKRGDREVEQLFKALEHTTEVKHIQIEKIVECTDTNLPRTIADIQVALHMCEETLKVANKFNAQEVVEKKSKDCASRLEVAKKEFEDKLTVLKEDYKNRELELAAQYANLEYEARNAKLNSS